MTGVFFASQNTFILRGKTTFAYPFIQFFLGQCLRGGEMFLIFLPIFFILSPNEFQEVYVFRMLVYRLSLNYVFRTAPSIILFKLLFNLHAFHLRITTVNLFPIYHTVGTYLVIIGFLRSKLLIGIRNCASFFNC